MSRMIEKMTLRQRRGAYVWTVWVRGREPLVVATDGNLGHIMSAWSVLVHTLEGTQAPPALEGTIVCRRFVIESLIVAPYRYRIEMESGPYRFEANVDGAVRSVTDAMSAAMKFFGLKYGLVAVYPEVTRTMDEARQIEGLAGTA